MTSAAQPSGCKDIGEGRARGNTSPKRHRSDVQLSQSASNVSPGEHAREHLRHSIPLSCSEKATGWRLWLFYDTESTERCPNLYIIGCNLDRLVCAQKLFPNDSLRLLEGEGERLRRGVLVVLVSGGNYGTVPANAGNRESRMVAQSASILTDS